VGVGGGSVIKLLIIRIGLMKRGTVLIVCGLVAGLCAVCFGVDEFGIVRTRGTEFVVGGEAKVFVGVNHYQCIMQEMGIRRRVRICGRSLRSFCFRRRRRTG